MKVETTPQAPQIQLDPTASFEAPPAVLAKEEQEIEPCDPAKQCPVKEVLRFLAGAWTPEIFYHLGRGPLRFGELQKAMGASPKMLTTRLRELEEHGIVRREVVPSKPPAVYYHLTDFGREFEPVLQAIVKVGKRLLKKPVAPVASVSTAAAAAASAFETLSKPSSNEAN